MKKFKSIDDLNAFKQKRLAVPYKTELTEPITLDEIDILRGKLDAKISQFNAISVKLKERLESVIHLICEIDDVPFGWWDYNGDGSDVYFDDNRVHFYFESADYSTLDRSFLLVNQEEGMPIGYLIIDREMIIQKYLDDVYKYHLADIQKREKQANKTNERKLYENTVLSSIKDKLLEEEYMFVLRKMGYTKKKIQKLGL